MQHRSVRRTVDARASRRFQTAPKPHFPPKTARVSSSRARSKSISPVKFPSGTNAFAVPFKLFRKASVNSASSTPSVYVESAVSAVLFATVCADTPAPFSRCTARVRRQARCRAQLRFHRGQSQLGKHKKRKQAAKNANTRRLRPRLYRLRRYRYINHQSFPIRQYTPKKD